MKRIYLIYFLFFVFLFSFFTPQKSCAQNNLVKQWDNRYGGDSTDALTCFQQTSDGGFILGGYSLSDSSGDKSDSSRGKTDFWVVKVDSLGNKQWDKVFGSAGDDKMHSLQQTTDGGYILGGSSTSGIGGDKTQVCWGQNDFWVVKIDSLGNKQWDKDFGGTDNDQLWSLQQTTDGGYILCGYTGSSDGDKTQGIKGGYDYWVVKIDSLGNKKWDKDFGGNDHDAPYSVRQTTDGGYLIGGFSSSNANGDKTQPSRGVDDYWIVKMDSLGNKQWDKDFGGLNSDELFSLQLTADGGCILAGRTLSGIGGDKTGASQGGWDFWVVKVDSVGNKQWDKDFGGTDNDEAFGISFQLANGGYLFVGTAYSQITGDKTENNLGPRQGWLIETDSLGNKKWDKTILTAGQDEEGYAVQLKDGCFAFANYTPAGTGGYKSQQSQGGADYWLVKFCEQIDVGVSENDNEQIKLYPNPASNQFTVYGLPFTVGTMLEVYNVFGEKVYNQQLRTINSKPQTINCKYFVSGVYFVHVTDGRQEWIRKLIIEK